MTSSAHLFRLKNSRCSPNFKTDVNKMNAFPPLRILVRGVLTSLWSSVNPGGRPRTHGGRYSLQTVWIPPLVGYWPILPASPELSMVWLLINSAEGMDWNERHTCKFWRGGHRIYAILIDSHHHFSSLTRATNSSTRLVLIQALMLDYSVK